LVEEGEWLISWGVPFEGTKEYGFGISFTPYDYGYGLKIGSVFKGVGKVVGKVLPIAAPFAALIPGVGLPISMAIGVAGKAVGTIAQASEQKKVQEQQIKLQEEAMRTAQAQAMAYQTAQTIAPAMPSAPPISTSMLAPMYAQAPGMYEEAKVSTYYPPAAPKAVPPTIDIKKYLPFALAGLALILLLRGGKEPTEPRVIYVERERR